MAQKYQYNSLMVVLVLFLHQKMFQQVIEEWMKLKKSKNGLLKQVNVAKRHNLMEFNLLQVLDTFFIHFYLRLQIIEMMNTVTVKKTESVFAITLQKELEKLLDPILLLELNLMEQIVLIVESRQKLLQNMFHFLKIILISSKFHQVLWLLNM